MSARLPLRHVRRHRRHVIGVLIPERWTHAIDIPETAYRWFSATAGTLAAVLIIAGVIMRRWRKIGVPY